MAQQASICICSTYQYILCTRRTSLTLISTLQCVIIFSCTSSFPAAYIKLFMKHLLIYPSPFSSSSSSSCSSSSSSSSCSSLLAVAQLLHNWVWGCEGGGAAVVYCVSSYITHTPTQYPQQSYLFSITHKVPQTSQTLYCFVQLFLEMSLLIQLALQIDNVCRTLHTSDISLQHVSDTFEIFSTSTQQRYQLWSECSYHVLTAAAEEFSQSKDITLPHFKM